MAGRLAPFIELGVGFNPELTSRENVVAQRRDDGPEPARGARARLDAVLDFAELREFADLKLKNYSSGMMVRLAFAVMVEADADIMLIDEVLAVGDAAFAQKCMDVFHEKRRARARRSCSSPTTWRRSQSFCDRAMLIHDGELRYLGDPEETALRYYRAELRRRRTAAPTPSAERRAATSTCGSSTPGSRTPAASASTTSSRASRSRVDVVLRGAPRPRGAGLRLPLPQRATACRSSASTAR